MKRRDFLLGTGALVASSPLRTAEGFIMEAPTVARRRIPKSQQESLPVVGLGTYKVFDVALAGKTKARLQAVMDEFTRMGGTLVDSSPMYGRAEAVSGQLIGARAKMFRASKVWTRGATAGKKSLERSVKRMGGALDLAQVHNLVDWQTHLPLLREMRTRKKIRYVGVTDYRVTAFPTIQKIVESQDIDFVQIPYSVVRRDADRRLLDVCEAHRVAVIVLSPFEGGALFKRFGKRKIPPWMQSELQCFTWAQVFLKWILGHPAVTCPIPATGKPRHLRDNMSAGMGRFPTAAQRRRILKDLS